MTELDPTQKIGRRNPINNSSPRLIPSQQETLQGPETIDRVTLSHKTEAPPETTKSKTGGEIREKLVSKFRDILENGTYQVKADEIADKMVQKIREQKNSIII
jgi:anti-sigma28 factor (negative regulator of flagellin synthesis)